MKVLDELTEECSSLFSLADSEILKARIGLLFSDNLEPSERELRVQKCMKMLCQNINIIDFEDFIEILSKKGEVRGLVRLCSIKSILLNEQIDKISKGQKQSTTTNELQKVLTKVVFFVMKLLTELQKFNSGEREKISNSWVVRNVMEFIKGDENKAKEVQLTIEKTILSISDNYILHESLFIFYDETNNSRKIVESGSPYVRQYLEEKVNSDLTNPRKLISLCNFFKNKKEYANALDQAILITNFNNDETVPVLRLELHEKLTFCNMAHDLCINLTENQPELAYKYNPIAQDLRNNRDLFELELETLNELDSLAKHAKDKFAREEIESDINSLNYGQVFGIDLLQKFGMKYELWKVNLKIILYFFLKIMVAAKQSMNTESVNNLALMVKIANRTTNFAETFRNMVTE